MPRVVIDMLMKITTAILFLATLSVVSAKPVLRSTPTPSDPKSFAVQPAMLLALEELDYCFVHNTMALVQSIQKTFSKIMPYQGSPCQSLPNEELLGKYLAHVGKITDNEKEYHHEFFKTLFAEIGSDGKVYYLDCNFVVERNGKTVSFGGVLCEPPPNQKISLSSGRSVDVPFLEKYYDRISKIIDFSVQSIKKVHETIEAASYEDSPDLRLVLSEITEHDKRLTLRTKPWFIKLKEKLYYYDMVDGLGDCRLFYERDGDKGEFTIKRRERVLSRIKCDDFLDVTWLDDVFPDNHD